jgi:hypothetical protein
MDNSCRSVSVSICWVSKPKTYVDENWYQRSTGNRTLNFHWHIFQSKKSGKWSRYSAKLHAERPVFQSRWRKETFSSPKPPRPAEKLTRPARQWVFGFFSSGTAGGAWSRLLITTFFFLWRCDPTRIMASSFLRFLDHTQQRTTVGRTPVDEWSARRRILYLTIHNTLLLILPGAELPSWKFWPSQRALSTSLDPGRRLSSFWSSDLHLADVLCDFILPSVLGSSLWSFG